MGRRRRRIPPSELGGGMRQILRINAPVKEKRLHLERNWNRSAIGIPSKGSIPSLDIALALPPFYL